MSKLRKHLEDPRKTPQSRPIPGREAEMEKNRAGGYAFKTGDWERLDRFLILGTEGGTYYASERDLTRENADVVRRCLQANPARVIARATEVSTEGLAPKNSPAILVLAMSFCVQHVGVEPGLRRLALRKVCRTGTHLMEFLDAATSMRGGGRALNGAVREWLKEKTPDQLAFQMTKYRQRGGWTWRDVLRRYRPKPGDDLSRQGLYRWGVTGSPFEADAPDAVVAVPDTLGRYLEMQTCDSTEVAMKARELRAPWEWVPSELSTDPKVLDALFDSMPIGATVRQLSKLTAHGVLPARKDEAIARIVNPEAIQKGRLHPVSLFLAQKAYEVGKGRHLTWTPIPEIVDALDDAFRVALEVGDPIEQEILIAVDTSGSMGGGFYSRGSDLPAKPIELGAAMALGLFAQCKHADVIGFDTANWGGGSGWTDVPLSKRMRGADATRAFGTAGGGTDCSLPFQVAKAKGRKYGAIVVFTDGESWAGSRHAQQAAHDLRLGNPGVRTVWCAMTASKTQLNDPKDNLSLGICGFSSDVPKLIADFVARKF